MPLLTVSIIATVLCVNFETNAISKDLSLRQLMAMQPNKLGIMATIMYPGVEYSGFKM